MRSPVDEIDKFLSLAVRSELIAQARLDELVDIFHKDEFALSGTIAELVSFLIARGVLTKWQCRKLREGKFKGFFLDEYRLLDHLRDDDSYNYYLALNTSSQQRVVLRIHLPKGWKAWWKGSIKYDVDEPLSE